jgi:hypothetical protein
MEVEHEPKRTKPDLRLVWSTVEHPRLAQEWYRVHSTDMAKLAIVAANVRYDPDPPAVLDVRNHGMGKGEQCEQPIAGAIS